FLLVVTRSVKSMQFTEHNNSIKITVPVTLDALSAHDVNSQLLASGYGRCLIIQDQITNLLVEYQQIQQKIKEKLRLPAYSLLIVLPKSVMRSLRLTSVMIKCLLQRLLPPPGAGPPF